MTEVLVEPSATDVVFVTEGSIVASEDTQVQLVEATSETVVLESSTHIEVVDATTQTDLIEVAIQGVPGGGTGGGGGVFILDAVGVGGIVGEKTYEADGVPLATAVSDTSTVRIFVGADGGAATYKPAITVNGLSVALTESTTKRWFLGDVVVPLVEGENIITAESADGDTDVAIITRAGAGPDVLGVTFGAYPGTQTELKQGDVISVTVTTAPAATSVTIQADGASASTYTWPVVGGIASGQITVSSRSGQQALYLSAKNALGTEGAAFVSGYLTLNQTYPTLGVLAVSYPSGKTAFGSGDVGSMTLTASAFDTISYSSSAVSIDTPTVYAATKPIALTASGYQGSGTNITVTATRAANNATTIRTGLARYATVAPTAAITIDGNPPRLSSSPTGIDYVVRITPSQDLSVAPSLAASAGTWQGSWTYASGVWRRSLRISDAVPRGAATFSDLSMNGLSNLAGDSITSGADYIVGGLSTRTLTFPAFSRTAAIGASVGDASKTSATIVGGNTLARQTTSAVVANGYYIADSTGGANPTGSYLALSDTALAGANTTGTLQVSFGEAA